MKTSSAKAKGRKLQQTVRDAIQEAFKLSEDDVRSTSMGAGGVDVQLSAAAKKVFPFSVECKSLAKVAVYKFYEQARANCAKDTVPLVVVKQNGSMPLAILGFDTFMAILQELEFYKSGKHKEY